MLHRNVNRGGFHRAFSAANGRWPPDAVDVTLRPYKNTARTKNTATVLVLFANRCQELQL